MKVEESSKPSTIAIPKKLKLNPFPSIRIRLGKRRSKQRFEYSNGSIAEFVLSSLESPDRHHSPKFSDRRLDRSTVKHTNTHYHPILDLPHARKHAIPEKYALAWGLTGCALGERWQSFDRLSLGFAS